MIIKSLLNNDLYKLTMMQFVRHQQPRLKVDFTFKCRDENVDLRPYVDEINEEISYYEKLQLTNTEANWLDNTIPFLSSDYIRSFHDFRFSSSISDSVRMNPDGTLDYGGNWYEKILYEVPVLSVINEVYFKRHYADQYNALLAEGRKRLGEKIAWLKENADVPFNIMEFGTRRRFSSEWQREVLETLLNEFDGHPYVNILGTSNVKLAQEFGIKAMGTMAHEFLQAFQVLAPIKHFQTAALEAWADEYRGNLGIALTDVVGMDAFLRSFHKGLAKLYDGGRQDSGDEYEWCDKLLAHYRSKEIDIDPRTKNAVFSNDLKFYTALPIARHYDGQIRTQFGIGTWLTNDMGVKALPIVIKMVRADGMPVAKISDSPGKEMCKDEVYLAWLRQSAYGKQV